MYVKEAYFSKIEHPTVKTADDAFETMKNHFNRTLEGYETVRNVPIRETTEHAKTLHHDYDHHYFSEEDDCWRFELIIIGD